MADTTISIKTGNDIDWYAQWLVNGVPQNLDDYEVVCQIKDTNGTIVVDFDVTNQDQTKYQGSYLMSCPASVTANIRPGVYDCDVLYRNLDSDQVESTETFLVQFVRSISSKV